MNIDKLSQCSRKILNASNSNFKRKQRNLPDNSPHSKEAQSRIRQASTPNAKRRSNSTGKHTSTRGKTWNPTPARNKAHGRWKWRHSPLNNFSAGQIGVHEYTVQKSRFRLHYERVLSRTQLHTVHTSIPCCESVCHQSCLSGFKIP